MFEENAEDQAEVPALTQPIHYERVVPTDGYVAYNNLGKRDEITLLACMAHARRYFEKALDHDQKRAEYALSMIQSLYAIEREAKAAAITHPERE
ncbi:MAG: transposase [Bacteroidota bacterium]